MAVMDSGNMAVVDRENKAVVDRLAVPGRAAVRQRKVSMEDNKKETFTQKQKPTFKRSTSIDSGVFLTPPSSPRNFLTPPSSQPGFQQFTPYYSVHGMHSQHGANLAFSFMLEQEMGLEKLKQE